MAKYRVGSGFPYKEVPQAIEDGFLVSINDNSFDIIGFLHGVRQIEIDEIKKGKLTLALYENERIPFIIGILKGIYFDVFIKMHKIDSSIVNNWVAEKAQNQVNIVPVDRSDLKVRAVRKMKINFTLQIKVILSEQMKNYSNADEVDRKALKIQSEMDFLKMLQSSIFRQSFG